MVHATQLVIQVDTPAAGGVVHRAEQTVMLDSGRFSTLRGAELYDEVRDLVKHLPALLSRQGLVWDGRNICLETHYGRNFVAKIGVKPR